MILPLIAVILSHSPASINPVNPLDVLSLVLNCELIRVVFHNLFFHKLLFEGLTCAVLLFVRCVYFSQNKTAGCNTVQIIKSIINFHSLFL